MTSGSEKVQTMQAANDGEDKTGNRGGGHPFSSRQR